MGTFIVDLYFGACEVYVCVGVWTTESMTNVYRGLDLLGVVL